MTIFSFRAECLNDVNLFVSNDTPALWIKTTRVVPDQGFPDVEVEIETNATIEQLHEWLNKQPDSHIIYETLRPVPLSENPLTRMNQYTGIKE